MGVAAVTVTDPGQLADAWRVALSADRPLVLDVHTDPTVPPIPPHATFDQVRATAQALVKGDAGRWGVLKEGLKIKAQEVLPHRE
jgi:pyruvate dehydrogenase (quinone)